MSKLDKRKCCTFTWTVENISFNWQKSREFIRSPEFVINAQQEFKYYLILYPHGLSYENEIGFFLEGSTSGILSNELAFLSKDCAVIKSSKKDTVNCFISIDRNEVFVVNRSAHRSEDELIVRCKIWKSDEEMAEDVQYFARTRICLKKKTFLWKIRNFSRIHSEERCMYQIKSISDKEVLMTLDLLLKNPYTDEDSINIQLVCENGKIKNCVLHLMPLNGFGSANQGISKQYLFSDNKKPKLFTLPFSKKDLMAVKDLCLPNDVLSFRCVCSFSTGDIIEEIESVIYGCESLASIKPDNQCFDEKNSFSVSKRILNDNLKSLFHDNIFSDIKLKTSTKTFTAHKSILSTRSPVFKALFSNNMKEKFTGCVEIKDMDSDTMFRMLHYVYTAEIHDLQWGNACELYRAADKYEILALREECSTYIKSNLSPNKACEVLILADMHQDEDLKASVQEFIFNHDILNSKEWKHFIKTHSKLAADTMYLQIQRKLKFPGNKFSTIEHLFGNRSGRINSVSSGFESATTKTTSTSSVINSSTVSKPFQPSFSFNSNAKKSPASSVLETSSGQTPSTSPGLSIRGGGSLSASHEFNSNETEFLPECGMKYVTPSTEPQFYSSIPNTNTASSGINSSNISIPFTSKGFNFNTTEKSSLSPFSFDSSGQKSPVKPSFLFANSSEKKPAELSYSFGRRPKKKSVKPSFSFGNSSEKEPAKLSFSFGSSDKKESVKPSFSFGNNREKESVKPLFSIGNNCEKEPVKTLFSFGKIGEKEPSKRFSQGNSDKKEPLKPSFLFANSSEKKPGKYHPQPSQPSFTFASNDEKEPPKQSFACSDEKEPAKLSFSFSSITKKESVKESLLLTSSDEKELVKPFSLAGGDEKEPIKPSFSFSSRCSEKEHVKPSFSFVNSSEKKTGKPSFTFANSDEKEPAKQSFSISDKKEPVKLSFSFSSFTEKEPIKESLSLTSSDEKELVKPSFSSSISSEKEPVKPSFFSSISSEKEPVNSISYGNTSETESVKESFSFALNNEKEHLKPYFLVSSSSEKQPDKQSFPFSSYEEKEPVNQTLSFGISCAVVPSPSPGFNRDTRQKHLEFPKLDNSSVVTCAANGSCFADMHSMHPVFNDSNSKTSSSLGFKSTNGDTTTASGISSSIMVKSTSSIGISSIDVKPSKPFFSFGSIGVEVSSSSEFNSNNEAMHFASLASDASSAGTQASSGSDKSSPNALSDFDIDNRGKLSVSTGSGNSSLNTPTTSVIDSLTAEILSAATGCGQSSLDASETSGIDSGSAKISSELDCACAETPSSAGLDICVATPASSGFDNFCAMTPSVSSGFDSSNGLTLPASHAIDSSSKDTTVYSGFNNTNSETRSPSFVLDCDNGRTSTPSECKPPSSGLN